MVDHRGQRQRAYNPPMKVSALLIFYYNVPYADYVGTKKKKFTKSEIIIIYIFFHIKI